MAATTKKGVWQVEIQINGKTIKNNLTELKKEAGKLRRELKGMNPAMEGFEEKSKAFNKARNAMERLRKKIYGTNKGLDKTNSILDRLNNRFSNFTKLIAGYFAFDVIRQWIGQVARSVQQLFKLQSTLKKLTGLQGVALKKATVTTRALATTFQKDIGKMSEAARNFSKQMNISFAKSLELIKQGFLDGADANEDFLNKVREYPTLLKEVGLSADESIALMTQEVKQGIYSDKGIDAIKEANLRLREMPKTTKEALFALGMSSEAIQKEIKSGSATTFEIIQRISKQMASLPAQSSVVGQAIADVFGGPGEDAGFKYLSTLHKIDLSMTRLTHKTDDYTKAKELEITANEKLNSVFLRLTSTGSALQMVYSSLKLGLASILETLAGMEDKTLEAQAAFDKQADSVISLDKNLVPLIGEYQRLTSKSKLSKQEQNRLQAVIRKIGDIVPTAVTAFDQYGKALDISTEKAEEFITRQKTLLRYKNSEVIKEQTQRLSELNSELEKNNRALNNRNKDGDIVKVSHTFTKTDRIIVNEHKLSGEEIAKIQARQAEIQNLLKEHQTILDAHNGDYLQKVIDKQKAQTENQQEQNITRQQLEQTAARYRIKNIKDLTDTELRVEIDSAISRAAAQKEANENRQSEREKEKRKIIASKKKLAAFLKEWKEEENLQKELEKLEEHERAEAEEIARIELKFEKMEEQAQLTREKEVELSEEERLLKTQLEQAKQTEIDNVRNTHEQKRLKALKKQQKKIEKLTADHNKRLAKSEMDLQLARKRARDFGIATLRSFFGEKTGIYKALFVLEKSLAINDVINNASKSVAQIKANLAIANTKALAASPLTGGMPYTLQNTLAAAKSITSTKITAGVEIAKIAATTIQGVKGFEDGLYPVTRDDGKRFKARLGGPTATQIVGTPTLMENYLVGERSRPEMIIDDRTFSKLDPRIIQYILDVHKGDTAKYQGYEEGKYQNEPIQNEEDTAEDSSENTQDLPGSLLIELRKLNSHLDSGLLVGAVIGDDQIEEIKQRSELLEKTRENAKIK